MKILMLTPYLPYPPASGGQIRTYNLLKYLSRNNEITLISLYKNKNTKKDASYLKSFCKKIYLCKRAEKPWQIGNILKSIFSLLPFLIVRNYSSEAKKEIKELLEKENFDVIHAETFYIMPHIPETKIPILLVEQTIEYQVYQHFVSTMPIFIRAFFFLDILKLKFWETYYWKKATLVSSVSQQDKLMIKRRVLNINPVIIPNGAGDEMFVDSLVKKNLEKPSILFVGNFYWLQNVEAASYLINRLFPRIKDKIKDVLLIIAGQNALDKIKYNGNGGIKIIDIPQNDSNLVKKLYHEATLFIAPIFGPGGTRLKILAAMASGLPVIATKIGVEGLKTEDKKHVLIAKTTEEFVRQTEVVLKDKNLYDTLRKNSYQLAKSEFSWESISKQLEIVYKNIINSHENRH
ncbi:MAG: glycosyltransferase family 4 protein [Candidatus Roizmanbacteria bacterium]|nr:MAG: glycosyltransferase family 4 protein [Candidatus Roizmanbacteria bacterium]